MQQHREVSKLHASLLHRLANARAPPDRVDTYFAPAHAIGDFRNRKPAELNSAEFTKGERKMGYQYKMIQLPPAITLKAKEEKGQEAAIYLQTIANEQAQQGWEFYRIDTVGVVTQPGCLASLFGAKQTYINYYVITFRRQG